MKKTLFCFVAFLVAASATAQQQTLFPPGTVLFPGLAVQSDRRSGLFQKDATTLAFSVNGVESFSFTKSGIVGAAGAPPAGTSFMVHLDPNQVPESSGSVWGLSNGIKFEGTTADDFEISFGVIGSPTSDTLYVVQDSANAVEYVLSNTSATANVLVSPVAASGVQMDLVTNAPHVADSIWGETKQWYWEGSNEDTYETRLGAVEATAITRVWMGDYNANSIGGNVWLPVSTGSANSVLPGAATSVWLGGSQIEFEGTSEDTIELRLRARDPTGTDKEIWLPNLAGDLTLNGGSLSGNTVPKIASGILADSAIQDDGSDVTVTSPLRSSVQNVDIPDTGDANPAQGVITPTTSFVALTCSDTGQQPGCEMTLSETGAVDGQLLTVVLVATTFSVEWEDDAGVMVTTNPSMNSPGDSVSFIYSSTAGFWVMTSQSMNQRGNFRATLGDNRPDRAGAVWSGTSDISFEGATADGFELKLAAEDPDTDGVMVLYQDGSSGAGWEFNDTLFANLPAANNGTVLFCSNCDPNTEPCAGVATQTGNFAWRENGAWNCK